MSLEIQTRNNTVSNVDRLIERQTRVLESWIEKPEPYFDQTRKAANELKFHNVSLHNVTQMQAINEKQFIRSLAENLRSQLLKFSASHVSQNLMITTD